ncbi:MAG: M48 family metalloprotease, partial [Coriobacteriia bacterium]|nr:M48 family metalloprotease [Coriobacteriia bacterium]
MTRYIGRPARIEPLWVRVERNRVKLAVFMVCFVSAWSVAAVFVLFLPTVGLFFGIGILAGDAFGGSGAPLLWRIAHWGLGSVWNLMLFSAGVGAVTAVVYAWYALTRPLWRQMTAISAFRPGRGEYRATKSALRDMAIASGFADCLPMLYVIESTSINAFMVGRGWHRAYCVVTTGMAKTFDAEEQRAVFANLMARLRAGDIQWATVVSTLMAPVWKWRQYDLERGTERGAPEGRLYEVGDRVNGPEYAAATLAAGPAGAMSMMFFGWAAYMAAVIASELVAFGHRRSQLLSAEVADSEGMLLLKDPVSMLRTLRKAIIADNRLRVAAPLYAQLFYIWAGDDLADDDDPEWRRLERLREVLGVEGIADAETELFETGIGAPGAPRLEGTTAAAAESRTIVLPQWVLVLPLIFSALAVCVAAGHLFGIANVERPVMLTQPVGP